MLNLPWKRFFRVLTAIRLTIFTASENVMQESARIDDGSLLKRGARGHRRAVNGARPKLGAAQADLRRLDWCSVSRLVFNQPLAEEKLLRAGKDVSRGF
ncbi:MAG TPA: hypothetical protein PKA58_35300, partial [Polyangium sp.]|nr:hypothetical protein [Polyangium sp.]